MGLGVLLFIFVKGVWGELLEGGEIPEIPEKPEIPDIPEIPEIPDNPEKPEIPEIPEELILEGGATKELA